MTALRPDRRDRVCVELDGAPWRTLPADAVVAAGLQVGTELDRARARELARALRRTAALTAATRALARRDRSAAGLNAYLSERGVKAPERAEAVEALARFGYVDDGRFAASRAAALARRGFGDEAIRFDLERQLVGAEQIEAALAELEPEVERAHALAGRSHSSGTTSPGRTSHGRDFPGKTAQQLATRGFSFESIESAFGAIDG